MGCSKTAQLENKLKKFTNIKQTKKLIEYQHFLKATSIDKKVPGLFEKLKCALKIIKLTNVVA